MPKIARKPKTASLNIRMLPELKAEAERVYTDSEAIEALREAELLKKDKTAKSFKTMEALIADLESDEDD